MKSLVGTWALVRASSVDADGRPLPPPYGGDKGMGRLTFNADGRMISVLCDGRPSLQTGEQREYNSYCGNYTFDGATLVTRVDAAKDVSQVGGDQVRAVRFEGPHMVLRPPFRANANRPAEQRELWWEKIAEL